MSIYQIVRQLYTEHDIRKYITDSADKVEKVEFLNPYDKAEATITYRVSGR